MMTTQSLEYATIRKCLPQLKSELSLDLSIADDLLADDFISEPASKKMRLTGVDDHAKAGELIDNILHRIEMKQERYHEFITILRKEPSRESMVELLEKTYEEEKQHRKYSHRSSSFGYDATEADCSSRRHSCPVIPGTWPRHRSSTSSSKGPDEVFSPTHPHKNGNSNDNELNPPNVLSDIADVSNWRNLGTQLGIESSKLDEIDRSPVEEQKSKMVTTWLNCDENPSWDKLHRALRRPSVNMNRAADKVASRFGGSSFNESLDAMDSIDETSSTHSKEVAGDQVIPFTEATVLDAVVKISNICELGQRLGIPDNLINDIEKYPIDERKQRLVSSLFQVKPENCNWDKVNAAIDEVAMYEWTATRRSSLTKSSSSESMSVLSSISIGTGGSADTSLPTTLENINTDTIKASYSKLLRNVERKLKGMDLNMEEFHSHIKIIFKPEDLSRIIKDDFDVQKIFKALTDHHLWKFENISKLQKIVEFIEDDESLQQLQELIRKYKFELNGYLANTKIIDRIRSDEIKEKDFEEEEYESIKSNKKKYDIAYRKKLSVALFKGEHGRKLTMESLMYIDKVWNELCDEFDISLSSVLDSIRENCIEITWLIPSVSAQQILKRLEGAVEFFKRKFISCVVLEGILIYSESAGIVGQKILDQTQLLLAVQDGSLERMKSVLETYNGDVDAQLTKTDMTALMIAAHSGSADITSALLELGADTNKQDVDGWTALFYATSEDHTHIISCLLEHGADVTIKTKSGATILELPQIEKDTGSDVYNILKGKLEHQLVNSAKEGNLSSVEVALRMGANVNATDPAKEGWTPLMWASWRGHLEVVGHLLKFNPDVNVAAKVGWTALILASREGHCEIIDALIDHGADIDQKTEKGWSSLMMAAALGRTQAGKILLERGAKIDCQDLGGYTPLGQACQDGHSDFVNMLIEHNPNLDVNIQTLGSWTPLMLACRKGHLNVAEVLIRNKVDIDLQKPDGVNALHVASYAGYNKTVRYLVQNKANVDITDIHGMNALMFAAKQGHVEVFKTLLWNGKANLNLQEKEANFSAPFFAVQCKHNEILDISMRNDNINLEIKDIEGNTLLDLAEKQNAGAYELIKQQHKDKIKLLESKKRLPSRAATPGGQLHAGPSTKGTQSENYIANLLRKIDLRMGQDPGIAASAA